MKWRHFKLKKNHCSHTYLRGTFYCFEPHKLPKENELEAITKTGALHAEISEQAKDSERGGE